MRDYVELFCSSFISYTPKICTAAKLKQSSRIPFVLGVVIPILLFSSVWLIAPAATMSSAYAQTGENTTTTPNMTNMTNMTEAITELSYYSGPGKNQSIAFSPEVIQYQRTDPTFAKLVQLVDDCMDIINDVISRPGIGKAMTGIESDRKATCDDLIDQGVSQFCTFEALDVTKRNAAKEATQFYTLTSGAIDITVFQ